MTKSWWSGEPGEQILDVLNPTEMVDDVEPYRLPVTWWTVALVIVVLVAFVSAGVWLVTDAAHTCKAAAGCFQPNR